MTPSKVSAEPQGICTGVGLAASFDVRLLSDVARATDLPKPSVRRALYTLTCLGLAASDGRTFRLTPRIMELASAYLGSNMVSTIVQPACERIGDRTEQSCFAAVLDGPAGRQGAVRHDNSKNKQQLRAHVRSQPRNVRL